MNVLITGATGFIGSRFALRCIELGHAVRVYGQLNTKAEHANSELLKRAGVELWLKSVNDAESVADAVSGMEVVFHLAAAQHEANVPDTVFWDVNVKGAQNLIEASVKAGVKKFVHGSTIGVYGSALSGVIDEHSPCEPDNIYGVTKYAAEKTVLSFKDRLPLVVTRISETYGPGDRRLLKLFKGIQKGRFPIIGSGENLHHLIYIDDLMDGFWLAAENEKANGEIFVLSGKEPVNTTEMVHTIANVLGRPNKIVNLPLLPFMMAAVLMEKILSPIGIQPPLHRRRMDFFKKSYLFSQSKAKEVLGFNPKISFREGAEKTAAWYRQQGLL